jgi:hypothetical protein
LDDRVLVLVSLQGTYRKSGIEVDERANPNLFTLCIDFFSDDAATLEAVGLRE